MTIPNVDENEEKLDHSYVAGGNLNGTTTLENSLVVP